MSQRCLIWGTPAEIGHVHTRDAFWVRSPRTGGDYRITGTASAMIRNGYLDDPSKAKVTTALVDRRRGGEDAPIVDSGFLDRYRKATELTHAERAERLLRYLADRESASPGDPVGLGKADPGALALSESWKDTQVELLLQHLEQSGWVLLEDILMGTRCTVTVAGYSHLADLGKNQDTMQVFVAMWFDDQQNDTYKNGIEPGIRDAGFVPHRIDEKKDADKIDDDIISEIRKSRFVVADMTHGSDGVRGSVYFEAGFARGYGLNVIYSCRKDCIDGLPFDTRQYHHIVWETPEQLREELAERIRARFGKNNTVR